MARGLERVKYTAEDGSVYTTRVKKNTAALAGAGWTAGTGADGALPKRFKMRSIHGVDADGFRRSIPIGTADAAYYTTPGVTFDLQDDDGNTVTYTRTGRTGEASTD